MTLTELKYIVAVAREKHFGKAAEACFVSQPTLSVAIKKLEDELEVKLFERSANEVSVTPLGEDIVRQAQSVLEQAAAIKEIAKRGKDPLAGPLKLGIIYTIGPYLLPDLVRQAIARTPQMPLMLQENFTVGCSKMLRTGEIDCAILAEPFPDTQPGDRAAVRRAFPGRGAQPRTRSPSARPSPRPKSSRARPCCCWARAIASATTCWRSAPSSRVSPAMPRASARASKARRWRPSSTWWRPAWASRWCRACRCPRSAGRAGRSQKIRQRQVCSGSGVAAEQPSFIKYLPFEGDVPSRRVVLAWRRSFTRYEAIAALRNAIYACELPGVNRLS
jgi:LysR family hydrogen peroxide-inducible transcriptional activator